jgi:hypothetical protein
MKKDHSKTILMISTFVIILSIINIIKILYYKGDTNIFGYISYIPNVLAIISLGVKVLKN